MNRALAVVSFAGVACRQPAGTDAPRALDAFDELAPWTASASDGVTASLQPVAGVHGQAMQLTFDLGNTSGYAVARRALALELPADFELAFELRGDAPINNLELKLIDQTGENVWWFHRADFAWPPAWRHMVVKRRQIEFAWGPIADHTLHHIAAIELVVSTGKAGGKGTIAIDELTLRARPVVTTPPPAPVATASSATPDHAAARAADGNPATSWRSAAAGPQIFTLDLGRERDLGGLIVQWAPTGFATDYTVELSRDARSWQQVGQIQRGNGGIDPFLMPESTARYVRLVLAATGGAVYELAELSVLDVEAGATTNAFVSALARQLPRGSVPRGLSGEQPYWTVVGVDGGGGHNSLMSEDGALELATGASVEPFVETAAGITSWATAGEITQALVEDYLPIPSVTWREPTWELTVTALASGDPANTQLAARYQLHNRTSAPLTVRLVLAVRPFQVNPPRQFLNIAGGVRKIARLAWIQGAIAIDGTPALRPLSSPDAVALWPFHALGYPVAPLATTLATPLDAVEDPAGLASGALGFAMTLAPDGEQSVVITAPLAGEPPTITDPAWFDTALAATRAGWHDKLDRVGFRVPAAGRPIIDTLRSSLAYMLLSRDGPILRPGTRSYARAWIRDGAMISEALLRLGHADVATAFLRWYAPYQLTSGKVPCCVEPHGAVPVPEHDSHGQLIHLAAEVARYTHDRAQLTAVWPNVQAAARYLEALRQSERTPANRTAERHARYGLLPPSISHEGYSAKAAYSYWDDFWGLVGFRDAAWIASELGEVAAQTQLAAQRDDFERDLLASVAASAADHHVAFIPGAADLGDFDATSTTIALSPGNAQHALPTDLLHATFERAWQQLIDRRSKAWTDYTPYELRLIGSFVRLGWRERAGDGLALYLADQRPRAWNQWAEVVGHALREPRFIGDMPHAWVHSDYARSALDLFAYERDDGSWVLAAGIPPAWFTGRGFAIERLPTPFGPLSYAVTATEHAVTLQIAAGALPPHGLAFPWPLPAPPRATRINGKPASWRGTELLITERPATIVIAKDL